MECPGCGKSFKVPDEYIGKRVQCNKCGEKFVVPEPELNIEYGSFADESESTDAPPSEQIVSDFEELLDELEEGNKEERRDAARQLRDLADPDAVDVLLDCMGDKDVEVRRYIAEAFGEMGGKQALAGLLGMAYDDDPKVQFLAYEAMEFIPEAERVELSAYFDQEKIVCYQADEMVESEHNLATGKLKETPFVAKQLYRRCESMRRNPNYEVIPFERRLRIDELHSHFRTRCAELGIEVDFD